MNKLRPRRGIAMTFGVTIALSASALAQAPSPESPAMSGGWSFDEQDGAVLYANVCAACHQPDAKGAIGAAAYPALAENKSLASPDYLVALLQNGLRGMPPLGRMMSDEQVANVVNYVRTNFGNNYDDAISAADVKAERAQMGSKP